MERFITTNIINKSETKGGVIIFLYLKSICQLRECINIKFSQYPITISLSGLFFQEWSQFLARLTPTNKIIESKKIENDIKLKTTIKKAYSLSLTLHNNPKQQAQERK